MKKFKLWFFLVLSLVLLFTGCKFNVGILPSVGETAWTYTATIDGVVYRGTLSFGKRDNLIELDGTLTQISPTGITKTFTGTLNRYDIKINSVNYSLF